MHPINQDALTPKSTNPKDRIGIKKPALGLVSPLALFRIAMAMRNGAKKYGPYNWRDEKVSATIYIDACLRHLLLWADGEENALDSNIHHLAHAAACLCILMDAEATDQLVDDRHKSNQLGDLLDFYIDQIKEEEAPPIFEEPGDTTVFEEPIVPEREVIREGDKVYVTASRDQLIDGCGLPESTADFLTKDPSERFVVISVDSPDKVAISEPVMHQGFLVGCSWRWVKKEMVSHNLKKVPLTVGDLVFLDASEEELNEMGIFQYAEQYAHARCRIRDFGEKGTGYENWVEVELESSEDKDSGSYYVKREYLKPIKSSDDVPF